MKLLEMKHIKKSFGELDVLKDISLEVNEGEVVAIIGPSGSGKSTLLRCATLLETMDAGTLAYCGKSATVNAENEKTQYISKEQLRELKNNFGLVFQNFNLFPHYSVIKNVTDAPIHVQKRDKSEVYKEAMSLLEKVGLDKKADNYPCQLSGGQQQRVAIIRALMMQTEYILADEPTSNLDEDNENEIIAFLKALAHEQNKGIIVASHSKEMYDAADICFRVRKGNVLEETL